MFYVNATLLFIPNIKQQSHKQESKMLIEHTSRSTEDKPKITLNLISKIYVLWCITTVNRVLQPTKSQYGQPTRSVTQPSRTAILVNPKSTLSLSMVNTKQQQQKVNAARSKSTINLNFCANKCRLQKSKFWERLGSIWPCVDQS